MENQPRNSSRILLTALLALLVVAVVVLIAVNTVGSDGIPMAPGPLPHTPSTTSPGVVV